MNNRETFLISITISEFGNLSKFYRRYCKGNREIFVEQIEFKGTDEQHNSGYMIDEIICTERELKDKVKSYIYSNCLIGESFDVRREGSKKSILTESDIRK